MNNKKFIDAIALEMGIRNGEAKQMVEAYVDTIISGVTCGNSVSIQGFGTFEPKQKASRKIYNPTTKEFIVTAAKQTIGFKMNSALKDKINKQN